MKAFILAAGRGQRLEPLTDKTPKPLLKAGNHTLIEHHLYKLAPAGISDVVINIAWLGEQIRNRLGDGSQYQLTINYSDEGDNALETAGGIIKALPLLGDEPFLVINADIWTDYDIAKLTHYSLTHQAHLVLIDNPEHNIQGDFSLKQNTVNNAGDPMLTYSGIGLYTKALFSDCTEIKAPLAPLLRKRIDQGQITGEHFHGAWTDVGTLERLNELNTMLTI